MLSTLLITSLLINLSDFFQEYNLVYRLISKHFPQKKQYILGIFLLYYLANYNISLKYLILLFTAYNHKHRTSQHNLCPHIFHTKMLHCFHTVKHTSSYPNIVSIKSIRQNPTKSAYVAPRSSPCAWVSGIISSLMIYSMVPPAKLNAKGNIAEAVPTAI